MHGAALRSSASSSLETQVAVFKSLLHTFAIQYSGTIKQNPTFRAEFARMCNVMGVDPLAGSNLEAKKRAASNGGMAPARWWNALAGGNVGDFYYDVGVRIVQACRESRGANGGLLGVDECRAQLKLGKGLVGGGIEVTADDIYRAVDSLKPLGTGFSIVNIGPKAMIRSVPKELNTDQATVLEAIQVMGYVTVSMLHDNLNWEPERAQTVLQDLLADSLVWLDAKCDEKEYWSSAFFKGSS